MTKLISEMIIRWLKYLLRWSNKNYSVNWLKVFENKCWRQLKMVEIFLKMTKISILRRDNLIFSTGQANISLANIFR
jgi:hypothetical protein